MKNSKATTVQSIRDAKNMRKIVCLTAYTSYMARLIDPYVDLILVGDSLGMVQYGMVSTVPVTLEMMIMHGRAVQNAADHAMVVVDLPFGSYQKSPEQAFDTSAEVLQQTGASAVKLEGGVEMAPTIRFLSDRGIAVMAHVGLQPQSVHKIGSYRQMGKTEGEAHRVYNDAIAVSDAGAFSVVLECVPEVLAQKITDSIEIPTIGIGASSLCDGQILVTEDMLGLHGGRVPSFVKQYESLSDRISNAVSLYADDTRKPRKEN